MPSRGADVASVATPQSVAAHVSRPNFAFPTPDDVATPPKNAGVGTLAGVYRFALRGRWIVGLFGVLIAAAVCVRLGIWQLDRLDEQLSFNDTVEERGELPVAPLDELLAGASPADIEYRPATVDGRFDAERELLVRARSFNGSPGMHVVTPLVIGDDRAVLVNRGFVPVTDPDAPVPAEAKPASDPVELVGVVRASADDGRFDPAPRAVAAEGTLGHITRVDIARLQGEFPYELAPVVVRVEAETPDQAGLPIPLAPPELGQGPHLSYAIQWFGFATVFVVGWPILVWRTGRRRTEEPPPQWNGHGRVDAPDLPPLPVRGRG